ncbi:MAG TPA: HdeD family acid-resistance protein [Methylomirabilota bacterium]|nr:HdeD family acid-resistance protein [Methylomirabilota bacterium]
MLMTLARNWWAIVLRGVCAVLFGVAAFAWPGLTLAVLVIMYGAYALVDGVLAVIAAIAARQPGRFPWGVLLAGLAAIGVGALTFAMPGLTALALLYLIAAWAIFRGVFEVIAAVQLRREIDHEWLLAASGVLSILLGLFLIVSPGAGALALLWAIGGMAIVVGVIMIGLGFRLRGLRDRAAPRLWGNR